jgi:hypothetical protein
LSIFEKRKHLEVMMSQENIWVLGGFTTPSRRHPSCNESTQALRTSYAFAWDVTQQSFMFGVMTNYMMTYTWENSHPCDPEVAEDILMYCSGTEATQTLFADWRDEKPKTIMCCCKGSLVTLGLNAPRGLGYRTLIGPAEMSISYYKPDGEVESLYLPIKMAQNFAENIHQKRRREIRVRLCS